jgi:Ca2+-binding EF-hand superfamily protein
MSSIAKPLYDIIIKTILCEERLERYKLTEKQIDEAFTWMDHRRRGAIDVSDFHSKFMELSQC